MKIRFIFVIAIMFGCILHASSSVKDAKIENDHLMLSFSKPIQASKIRHFALKGSDTIRYVFDFGDTIIRNRFLADRLSHNSVNKFRISQFNRSTVRVVIETPSNYDISHSIDTPYRYKISLPDAKKRRAGSPADLFASISAATEKQKSKIKKSSSSKKISKQKTAVKKPKKRYLVVIDPGHGGKDTGATAGRRYREKDVVLAISKKVRKHLQRLGFRVYMTRTRDRFVRLRDRTRYANRKKADAFVSIHANAIGSYKRDTAKGLESYFLQVTRSARSMRVAAKENSVVLRAKDMISKNVILNLMTGPKIVMSNKLAIDLQKGMLKNARSRYRGVDDHGVRPGPFWVLVGAQMPAVLVEVGYITHPVEKKRLIDPKYQDLIAKGIAEGISNYFANREREFE